MHGALVGLEAVHPQNARLLVDLCAEGGGAAEEEVVEVVALDVERGLCVAEVAEAQAAEAAVPEGDGAALADVAFQADGVVDAETGEVGPHVGDEALADVGARMALLFEEDDGDALVGEEAGGHAAGWAAADHDHVGARGDAVHGWPGGRV